MLYRLEKKIENEWYMEGTYSEKYLNQMASAVGDLYLRGFRMYKDLRIVKVNSDAEPDSV